VNLNVYDYVLVAFSGGKDSTAAFLYLLEQGVDPARIELHHHNVDGRVNGSSSSTLMDWPSTYGYCQAFARAFKVPIFFSWREGGFEREILRNDSATAPIYWQNPDGSLGTTGGSGPKGTRLKFPQVSSNLSTRWCSPALKIDVGCAAIRNQERFLGKKTLVVSGERAEESASRARYKAFEPDRATSSKRTVDRFRPVHGWTEQEAWSIVQRHRVQPHPAYRLSFSRLSCMKCIFCGDNSWASLRRIDPAGFQKLADYEKQFGVTIHRKLTLAQRADAGTPYDTCADAALVAEAMDPHWDRPIILPEGQWKLPAGAFGNGGGPS